MIFKRKTVVHIIREEAVVAATVSRVPATGNRVQIVIHGSGEKCFVRPSDLFSNREAALAALSERCPVPLT